jgi:hypothetical protein
MMTDYAVEKGDNEVEQKPNNQTYLDLQQPTMVTNDCSEDRKQSNAVRDDVNGMHDRVLTSYLNQPTHRLIVLHLES